jgi:hypothetical protein
MSRAFLSTAVPSTSGRERRVRRGRGGRRGFGDGGGNPAVVVARASSAASSAWREESDVNAWARETWSKFIERDDDVVDATLGRGRDALAVLANHGDAHSGLVYGFDVEPEALVAANEAFDRAGVPESRRSFHLKCHSDMLDVVPSDAKVGVVTFNLGYLPGGDKTTRETRAKTRADTTTSALRSALSLLRVGGCVTVIAYVGHEGGWAEHDAVRDFLAQLPCREWTVTTRAVVNRHNAPILYVVVRDR